MQFNANLLLHLRTNPKLVFVTEVTPSEELKIAIDNFDINSVDWKTAGFNPETEIPIDDGLIKVLNVYAAQEGEAWRFPLAHQFYELAVQEFLKIDPSATIGPVHRIQLNLTYSGGVMKDMSPHADILEHGYWSFLLHLRGNSGATDFFNSNIDPTRILSVPFKQYQLAMFPSTYQHSGRLPNANDPIKRLSLNFVVKVDTELNKHVADCSSQLLGKILKS